MEAPIPDGVNLSQSLAVRVIDPFQFHEWPSRKALSAQLFQEFMIVDGWVAVDVTKGNGLRSSLEVQAESFCEFHEAWHPFSTDWIAVSYKVRLELSLYQ
jgi:hypothetical protein